MSGMVVPAGWPSPAALTARVTVTGRDPISEWATRCLHETWADVSFDVGVRADLARVVWVDGPSLSELSTHLRTFCRSTRLDLRRNPSLSAMVWCARAARTESDGHAAAARRLFTDKAIRSSTDPDHWDRYARIGEVAARKNRIHRPTWGEIMVSERLLDGASDDVIDAAIVLAGETDLTLRELIQLAHRL